MPTALELTREEWQPYIEAARNRVASARPNPAELQEREHLLGRLRQLSIMLKDRFDVRLVVVFGSVAHPEWFTAGSDVDLAVEGLSNEDFWDAWRLAEDVIVDRPVDLVQIETAKPSLVRAIRRHGIRL